MIGRLAIASGTGRKDRHADGSLSTCCDSNIVVLRLLYTDDPKPASWSRIGRQTFNVWKKYAGLSLSEPRELRQLRKKNWKLKRLVSDLARKQHILLEIVAKKL
jgi:hypothetical protein